jgi:hypothetical protein
MANTTPGTTPTLTTICAWCPTFNPKDPRNRDASHTICPTCIKRVDKEWTS